MTNLVYEVGCMILQRMLDPNFLSKPVKIHVCKDRTLSVVLPGGKPFNGIALPVYSVDTEEEAWVLIRTAGALQYKEHPQIPGKPWLKINLDFIQLLELEHLPRVQEKLHLFHTTMQPKETAT